MMEIPAAVAHLIAINTEFAVLLCSSPTVRDREGEMEKRRQRREASEREGRGTTWEEAGQG